MKKLIVIICLLFALNIISLVYSLFVKTKLIYNGIDIGWPYSFYQRFRLRGSINDNHGWNMYHFFIDQMILILVVTAILYVYKFASKK